MELWIFLNPYLNSSFSLFPLKAVLKISLPIKTTQETRIIQPDTNSGPRIFEKVSKNQIAGSINVSKT